MGSEISAIPIQTLPLSGADSQTIRALNGSPKDSAELVKAAKDFESVFLSRLTQEMRRTVDSAGLLDDAGMDQMQDIFWMYLSQAVADQGGVGLWKELVSQAGGLAGPAGSGLTPPATVEHDR